MVKVYFDYAKFFSEVLTYEEVIKNGEFIEN